MQSKHLDRLIKATAIIFIGALLFSTLDVLNYILNTHYTDIQCEYHYVFLRVTHKAQHLGSLPYYGWAFTGLLLYTLFFRLPNKNHVIFYINVMLFLLLGCLVHDIGFRSPLNSFSKFVSHFMNGAFLLTAFNFILITFIAPLNLKKMLSLCLFTMCGFIINLIAFLIYFLFYEFIFGATSVYIFIFIFIFGIFQFNIMLICNFLKEAPLYPQT